jgi:polar amino acid transport system permease protein
VASELTEQPVRAGRPDDIVAVPVRHYGRWVAAAIVLLIGALLIHSMAVNKRFQWHIVNSFLTDSRIIQGLVRTLELTVLAMVIGVAGGVILAVMRLSPNPVVSGSSWLYIWFFRGTPVLLQIYFWFNLQTLYPKLSLGIPFGPAFWHGSANTLITKFVAATLALGLNEAAYMAEIVRAGIISVDEGQNEAAQSLGMTRLQTMRRIVLPQAMRVIIPPTGNETISMLKTTSLVSVIAFSELLYSAQLIYDVNYRIIQLLLVAAFWYIVVTSILYVGQFYLERYFARGSTRELPPTPIQRIRQGLFSFGHAKVELPTGEHR